MLCIIDSKVRKEKNNEVLVALFHKKRADYLQYFLTHKIVLPLLNKDLPWNKIYLCLSCLDLDIDVKSTIINALVRYRSLFISYFWFDNYR